MPEFTVIDMVMETAHKHGVSPEKASEYVLELTDSTGFMLLKHGASARMIHLSQSLVDLNPYTEPHRIVEVQAEINALGFLISGFIDEVETVYLGMIAERKQREIAEQQREADEQIPDKYIEV